MQTLSPSPRISTSLIKVDAFKVEISDGCGHYTSSGQRRYTHRFFTRKMCFKHVEEELSQMFEQMSNDDCPCCVDEIDGKEEHILKPSELNRLQHCQFDVCGNYQCLCEICNAEADGKEEKSRDYRLSRLKAENEKFKTSVICRKCKTNNVEILILPCTHVVTCEKCADILDNCPLCDERILGTVRIYMA